MCSTDSSEPKMRPSCSGQTPILSLHKVSSGYGSAKVLHELSFDVQKGEFLTIIGANGAGKTTLMRLIAGVQPIWQGKLSFHGADIGNSTAPQRVKAGLVLVPEGRKIFPKLSVQENLILGGYLRCNGAALTDDLDKVYDLFPVLKARRSQMGGTLSGGEQQMLALGRALMSSPSLILLDEPSMGIAPLLVARIFDKIQELNSSGITIVLVEQNAKLALNFANRALVLDLGVITIAGEAAALKGDPRIIEAYLGSL